jgi:hypothetical protein
MFVILIIVLLPVKIIGLPRDPFPENFSMVIVISLFLATLINLLRVYTKAKSTGELYLKNSDPRKQL